MALTTLNNLSVFGSDGGVGNQSLLMPKLQYRFRVEFFNFGIDPTGPLALTRQIIDCARPQVQFDDITLNVYNSRVYLAGKHTWQTLAINVRDDAGGEVSRAVGQQLQKQIDFAQQASASSGIDYKFQTILEILDGGNGANNPNILETWELYGCYLMSADYGDNNYASNEPMTVTLSIRYDNALQTPTGAGIGAQVTRTLGTVITG